MRIVHVITRLIVGGAQENTLLTCEGLHRRGHDVVLIAGPQTGPEGSLLGEACARGYEVIVLHLVARSPPSTTGMPRELRNLLTRFQPSRSYPREQGRHPRRHRRLRVGVPTRRHTIHA